MEVRKLKDLLAHYNRYYTKEQRDQYELNQLFKYRYSSTFDSIGKGGFNNDKYWTTYMEEERGSVVHNDEE